jgi:hypothetical protein
MTSSGTIIAVLLSLFATYLEYQILYRMFKGEIQELDETG